jgi:hypothetical protein
MKLASEDGVDGKTPYGSIADEPGAPERRPPPRPGVRSLKEITYNAEVGLDKCPA